MPPKRYNRNRRRKKQGILSKIYNYPLTLKKVVKSVQRIKGIINSELKHFDYLNNFTPNSTGQVIALGLMAQGDTNVTRSGLSVLAKSLEVLYTVTGNASAFSTNLRVIIVSDSMNTGTIPTVTDILQSVNVRSPYERSVNLNRFGKLYDKLEVFDLGGRNSAAHSFTIPLGNKHIKFNGSGATQADQGKGSMYCLLLSDQATNTPGVDVSTRMMFYDN